MGLSHLQFLFGLVLYFISPKVIFSSAASSVQLNRFYTIEHITIMLAVILITIGSIMA